VSGGLCSYYIIYIILSGMHFLLPMRPTILSSIGLLVLSPPLSRIKISLNLISSVVFLGISICRKCLTFLSYILVVCPSFSRFQIYLYLLTSVVFAGISICRKCLTFSLSQYLQHNFFGFFAEKVHLPEVSDIFIFSIYLTKLLSLRKRIKKFTCLK